MWLAVPLPDGSIGGGVRTRRWDLDPRSTFSSWFNNLADVLRMALYARRTGQAELLKLSRQTVEFGAPSPRTRRRFKCIAVPNQRRPSNRVGGPATGQAAAPRTDSWDTTCVGPATGCSMACGRTARQRRQSCRVARAGPVRHGPAAGRWDAATRFAEDGSVQERTLAHSQGGNRPDGPLPAGAIPPGPESPVSLNAAKKGLDFLEQEVLPRRQWYDYETFWSCSPRGAKSMNVRNSGRPTTWPSRRPSPLTWRPSALRASRVNFGYGEALLDYLLLVSAVLDESRAGQPDLQRDAVWAVFTTRTRTPNGPTRGRASAGTFCWTTIAPRARSSTWSAALPPCGRSSHFPSENWAHAGTAGKRG